MSIGKEILFFFGALGAFNGFILSLYFLFFTKKKYLTNLFLGASLLALSIRITITVFVYFNNNLAKTYLQIGLSACLLIGPFLFLYLKSYKEEKPNWKPHVIPYLVAITILGILYPYVEHAKVWSTWIIKMIYFQWFVYNFQTEKKSN